MRTAHLPTVSRGHSGGGGWWWIILPGVGYTLPLEGTRGDGRYPYLPKGTWDQRYPTPPPPKRHTPVKTFPATSLVCAKIPTSAISRRSRTWVRGGEGTFSSWGMVSFGAGAGVREGAHLLLALTCYYKLRRISMKFCFKFQNAPQVSCTKLHRRKKQKKNLRILLPAEFYCVLQQLKTEMSDNVRLILCSKNHPTLSAYWRRFFELFT